MPSSVRIRPSRSSSHYRDLPRSAGAARKPRSRPPEVSLHARRLDRGNVLDRTAIDVSASSSCPGEPTKTVPDEIYRDHVGIHPQRQPGLSYVGASVLRGRLTGDQLEAASPTSPRSTAAATSAPRSSQNIVVRQRARMRRLLDLARELDALGLHVEGSAFWRGAIACTGTEFCKLAITETKGFARWLVDELEERLPASTSKSAARHRLPQQLRPALDRRHRHRRQEDQARWQARRRLLLLRRRVGRPERGHCAPGRLSLPGGAGAGGD